MKSQIKLIFKIRNAECVVYFIIKAIHEILRINWMKEWLDFPRSVERCFSMYIVKLLKIFLQTLVANFGERKMYIHNFFTEHLRATAFVVSSIPFNLAKLGAQPGNWKVYYRVAVLEIQFRPINSTNNKWIYECLTLAIWKGLRKMSRSWKYFASLTKINRDVQLHYSIPVTLKGFINRLTVYELWHPKKLNIFQKILG